MEDFDLDKFVELFDKAMTSDNPTVRKAFKNLLMVAALVDSEAETRKIGPLENLVKSMRNLEQKVTQLEMASYMYKNTITTTPGMTPGTTPVPYYGTTWTAPSYTTTTGIATGIAGGGGGGSNGAGKGSSTAFNTKISGASNINTYSIDQSKLDQLFGNIDKI